MTPKAITSALAATQALFLPIDGQPSNDNLILLSNAILSILLKATYNRVHINGNHNLWGLVASVDWYLYHYGAPFVRCATHPACYDLAINTEASCVDRVCAETAWTALIQDYKAYKTAEHGVKVFIKAVVNDTWIFDLHDSKTFYFNVTALAIFNHFCEHSGSLHALDIVLLTIQMSQYYEGMTDIPEYIFLLCLPVTNQTLTNLASTAPLAANTSPRTTELWEELDPANKTWAA
jgi:hypothetical protein